MYRAKLMDPPAAAISARMSALSRALCASASCDGSGSSRLALIEQSGGLLRRCTRAAMIRRSSFRTRRSTEAMQDIATPAQREAGTLGVALVTGGAKRVGAEIARSLHAAGAKVAVTYRS